MSNPAARRLLRWIATTAGFAVLAWLAWDARHELQSVLASVLPGWLAAAVFLGIAFAASHGLLLARLMGTATGSREVLAAHLVSQPGKYVPGKVWPALMQATLLGSRLRFAAVALANLELAAIALLQMGSIGLACAWAGRPVAMLAALVAGVAASVAVVHLPVVHGLARLLPRATARLGLGDHPRSHAPAAVAGTLFLLAASFTLNFAASWCVVQAAGATVAPGMAVPLLACLYLAFAASMFALPVPAGVGVREAAAVGLGTLLAPGLPAATLVSVALLARAWQLAVDVACLAAGAAMQRGSTHRR